ncbi:LysE family translocator [Isoptericola sp. NPDC057391]|uniref:LysE family translocator n=1 Tax=Isoptericola sp. NPDC057391 TaxID=3346117 RepID=UPI00364520EA
MTLLTVPTVPTTEAADAASTLLPSSPALLGFLAASLAMLAVPGPSVVYVVARTTAHGRRAGMWSMAGLETGAALHVVAAAAGLAALLARSPALFDAVRWTGAAYLVWLGVRELRAARARAASPGDASGEDGAPTAPRSWRLFVDGVLVDVLNPKTALFFLAFLPQFADPARGPVAPQLALLGGLFVGLAALVDSAYALLADRMSWRLRASERARRRLGRASGGVYLALAGAAVVV